MEGLLKYSDLEEHFSSSLLIIDQQDDFVKGKQDLAAIVNKLSQEINILKESEQKLTQQLRTFSSSAEDQDGINSLYMKLKEKHNKFLDKYNQLEKENIVLEEKCTWEKNEIIEDFVRQMKILEENNEEQKKEFLRTQSELNNELALQQASADIRYDEMESHLQSQIRDITNKLHESTQSCNTIRQELFAFKTCNSSDIDSSKKRIQELERELRLSKQQLQLTEERLFHSTRNKNLNIYSNNDNLNREINQPRPTLSDSDRPANIIKNRVVVINENPQRSASKPNYVYGTTKYHSLNEEYQEVPDNANVHMETFRNVQVQSGAGSSRYNNKQNNSNYLVPPLKQISVTRPKQNMNVKKRKLYNPNNLDYLLDMETPE